MTNWVERAVAETTTVLRHAGLVVDEHRVLSASNRLVLMFSPCDVIAKVVPAEAHRQLDVEIAIARHAEVAAGPVARLDARLAAQPYRSTALAFSLWKRLEILGPVPDAEACDAYAELRTCLDSFDGALPDFREGILRAARLLDAHLPILSPNDGSLIRELLTDGVSSLSLFSWSNVALHGDAHAGNLVRTPEAACWLDFEAACMGPIEWDLSALPNGSSWSACDRGLLAHLVRIRHACVVAWCAVKRDPQPFELEAIEHHLNALRGG